MDEESEHLLRLNISAVVPSESTENGLPPPEALVGVAQSICRQTTWDTGSQAEKYPVQTPVQEESDDRNDRTQVVFVGVATSRVKDSELVAATCSSTSGGGSMKEPCGEWNAIESGRNQSGSCCYSLKHSKVKVFFMGTLILTILLLSVALVTLELVPPNTAGDVAIKDNDTVLVIEVNPLWYLEVTVHKVDNFDDHSLSLYCAACSDLDTNNRTLSHESPVLQRDGNFILFERMYLVEGSTVTIDVTVLNVSSPTTGVEMLIFDDISNYFPFLDGNAGRKESYAHKVVLTAGLQPITTHFTFQMTKTSYYFGGVLLQSPPIFVQYEYEMKQFFYMRYNYRERNCTVQDKKSCSVDLSHGFDFNPPHQCILGYAKTLPNVESSFFEVTAIEHRNHFNLLLMCVTALLGTTAIFSTISCACLCCYLRWKKAKYKQYVSLNYMM